MLIIAVAALGATVARRGVRFDPGMGGALAMVDPAMHDTVEAQIAELPPLFVLPPLMLVQSLGRGHDDPCSGYR